jgi:hypothetical protein
MTASKVHEISSRLGLGLPQRIMVETANSGPVLLHSYLNPVQKQAKERRSRDTLRSVGGSTAFEEVEAMEVPDGKSGGEDLEAGPAAMPLLIGTVVASGPGDISEARRAASKLERVGRVVQREWARGDNDDLVEGEEDG